MKKKENLSRWLACLISLLTLIIYLPALRNDFLQWDDMAYVFENNFIRSLNVAFFRRLFFDFYAANWHPLTWLSHAFDYAIWGLNPVGHHLTNILLHAANTYMVVFVLLGFLDILKERALRTGQSEFLTDRTILITAGATGLLFGLHPLHVESVAWVAERKDLLCALFFLLSIALYTKYVRSINSEMMQKNSLLLLLQRPYLLSLGYFTLALLSKPMAVSLPVVLLILDWYPFERIHSRRTFRIAFIEKLPFIALSLVSSILTVLAQKEYGAIRSLEFAPLLVRALVGAKSLIAYLWKMILPVDLIPYYLYPKDVSLLSSEYVSAIVLVIGITFAGIVMAKKQKLWLTAWGYYVITLFPVLGIVQVGNQAMADRYTYLPSLGPFVVMGIIVAGASKKMNTLVKGSLIVTYASRVMALSVIVVLIYLTVQQIGIWKNNLVFWNYIIENKSQRAPLTYNIRGVTFEKMGQLDKALADFDRAIALGPSYDLAYYNRALVLERKGEIDKAITDYDKAITLNPSFDKAYYNRGLVLEKKGEIDKAITDYDKAITLNPSFDKAYYNRGLVLEKKGEIDKAITDYDKAIALNPSFDKAYLARGTLFSKAGLYEKAIEYINRSISINQRYAEAYGTRGLVYALNGRYERALEDFNKAIELDPDSAFTYFNRGFIYQQTGNQEFAIADFRKACNLGNQEACVRLQAR